MDPIRINQISKKECRECSFAGQNFGGSGGDAVCDSPSQRLVARSGEQTGELTDWLKLAIFLCIKRKNPPSLEDVMNYLKKLKPGN